MSLRSRLVVVTIAIALVLGVVGVLIPRTVRAAQVEQLDEQLRGAIPIALRFGEPGAPPAPGPQPNRSLSDVYVASLATDGTRTIVISSRVTDREPQLPSSISTGPDTGIETVGSLTGPGSWRAAQVPTGSGGLVLVAVPLDRVVATIHRLQLALALAGAAVLLVLLAAGWWVMRLGLRPIAEVAQVADAIAGGDRDRRVTSAMPEGTEAAHLAKAFNLMADERDAAEERLRRFVADASHELRTPVTAIRGFTDLHRQGALDDEATAEAMRRIGQESARMRDLVDDLLLLARLDQGRPLEQQPVDLSAVLADAALDASATHPSRDVRVDVEPGLSVLGDDPRLRQVVANLVTNALNHGGAHATVRLSGHEVTDGVVLEVADDGVGMSADEAAHAFERFWRADASRARHQGGSGLGLAIVEGVVEAHGGHLSLDTAPGRGTRVRIVLPRAFSKPATSLDAARG